MPANLVPSSKSQYIFIEESKVHALFKKLGKFQNEPEIKSFLRASGGLIKDLIEENFVEGGSKVGGWVDLHWVTGALRRQSERTKIKNFSELSSRTHGFVPLNTSGHALEKQITRKVEQGEGFIRVGTTDPLVIQHHKGFTELFKFTPYKMVLLNRNIARRVGGKANLFYFWIFREMKKIDNTQRKTPARPIYFILPPENMRQLTNMGQVALTRMLTRMRKRA